MCHQLQVVNIQTLTMHPSTCRVCSRLSLRVLFYEYRLRVSMLCKTLLKYFEKLGHLQTVSFRILASAVRFY